MGLAYGACDDLKAGGARRVGVVVGSDGIIKAYFPKVSAAAFPQEALALV